MAINDYTLIEALDNSGFYIMPSSAATKKQKKDADYDEARALPYAVVDLWDNEYIPLWFTTLSDVTENSDIRERIAEQGYDTSKLFGLALSTPIKEITRLGAGRYYDEYTVDWDKFNPLDFNNMVDKTLHSSDDEIITPLLRNGHADDTYMLKISTKSYAYEKLFEIEISFVNYDNELIGGVGYDDEVDNFLLPFHIENAINYGDFQKFVNRAIDLKFDAETILRCGNQYDIDAVLEYDDIVTALLKKDPSIFTSSDNPHVKMAAIDRGYALSEFLNDYDEGIRTAALERFNDAPNLMCGYNIAKERGMEQEWMVNREANRECSLAILNALDNHSESAQYGQYIDIPAAVDDVCKQFSIKRIANVLAIEAFRSEDHAKEYKETHKYFDGRLSKKTLDWACDIITKQEWSDVPFMDCKSIRDSGHATTFNSFTENFIDNFYNKYFSYLGINDTEAEKDVDERLALAKQGKDEDLDRLVFDDEIEVREAVALWGRDKDLDILVNDGCGEVREIVAGFGRDKDLDLLVNDTDDFVRETVANFGRPQDYDILANDSVDSVRTTYLSVYEEKKGEEYGDV